MADSQSLVLLPPRPAAPPKSQQSLKKVDKPSQDHSFGQKLDKAKRQITAKSDEATSSTASVKDPAVTVAKTTANPEQLDQTTDDPIDQPTDPATPKVALKNPKPAVKDPTDPEPEAASTEESSDAEATNLEPVPMDAAAPAKAPAEKPSKKVGKNAEVKVSAPSDPALVLPVVVVKVQPVEQVSAEDDAAADQGSQSAPPTAVVTAAPTSVSDEADTQPTASSALFGSGKVVGKGKPGDGASVDANLAASSSAALTPADENLQTIAPVAAVVTEVDAPSEKTSNASTNHTPGATVDASGVAVPTSSNGPAPLGAKSLSVSKDVAPQVRFAEDNHPKIVTGIAGQLMPRGGTLQLQLNPRDLGALQVTVHIQDGVISASFETSNDDATRLLSHSLGQLKSGLEAAGVSVEKLHVEQAPQNDSSKDSNSESDSKPPLQDQQRQAQQDQQRKDMVQRMWRRLAGGSDPLDLVA